MPRASCLALALTAASTPASAYALIAGQPRGERSRTGITTMNIAIMMNGLPGAMGLCIDCTARGSPGSACGDTLSAVHGSQ